MLYEKRLLLYRNIALLNHYVKFIYSGRDCINLVGNKKAICYNILHNHNRANKQRRNRWLKIL
jgi:hypothetical protein